jgi:hypothetical protein
VKGLLDGEETRRELKKAPKGDGGPGVQAAFNAPVGSESPAKQGPPKIEVPLSDDEFNKMMKKLFGEGYQA